MKTYDCRCIRHGLVIYRFTERRSPPAVRIYDEVALAEEAQKRNWLEPAPVFELPPEPTLCNRIGVEVDKTGTWVRYEASDT